MTLNVEITAHVLVSACTPSDTSLSGAEAPVLVVRRPGVERLADELLEDSLFSQRASGGAATMQGPLFRSGRNYSYLAKTNYRCAAGSASSAGRTGATGGAGGAGGASGASPAEPKGAACSTASADSLGRASEVCLALLFANNYYYEYYLDYSLIP